MPGIIDDQVHFREPGLTHKEDIYHGSRAAVAGGVTGFMDMPNVNPPSLTQNLLEERYRLAAKTSLANFSFYMGVSNTNAEAVLLTDASKICGIKIFLGSSTGNLLVDNARTLEHLFKNSPTLIATHCEDEHIITSNIEKYKAQYGDYIPVSLHPIIRDNEACFKSSSYAVSLAKKYDTRLHILHISTADEIQLFDNAVPTGSKRITAEACVHHLYFDADDYATHGTAIKWNPAIKDARHKPAILQAVLDNKIDVIATDHAPHTWEEKQRPYTSCPSGAPMVQHSINIMLDFYHRGKLPLEKIAEKMSHAVADCFKIHNRGYLREGYFADLYLLNPDAEETVSTDTLFYKCGWSPLEGKTFKGKVIKTFVNGNLVFDKGTFYEEAKGMRMFFETHV